MNDETENLPAQTPEPTGVGASRSGLRHRVLGIRGVAAVAVASLILGGLGGAALGVVSSGSDEGSGPGGGRGPGGQGQFPGQPGQQQPGQQQPGQLPDGTQQLPPQDDVQPDSAPSDTPDDTDGATDGTTDRTT